MARETRRRGRGKRGRWAAMVVDGQRELLAGAEDER